MHRLAIKRNTKNEAQLSPNTHVTPFVRPPVGTVPFAAPADTCADTAECRLQCTRRAVRTANLHAVRSAITATAELLVYKWQLSPLKLNVRHLRSFLIPCLHYMKSAQSHTGNTLPTCCVRVGSCACCIWVDVLC